MTVDTVGLLIFFQQEAVNAFLKIPFGIQMAVITGVGDMGNPCRFSAVNAVASRAGRNEAGIFPFNLLIENPAMIAFLILSKLIRRKTVGFHAIAVCMASGTGVSNMVVIDH